MYICNLNISNGVISVFVQPNAFSSLDIYIGILFSLRISLLLAVLLVIQSASCCDGLLSSSLFNWLGLKGVLHKAAESTAGV